MAKLAVIQVEAAFTTSRDGGDAHSAAMFDAHSAAMFGAQLLKPRAIAGKLAKR